MCDTCGGKLQVDVAAVILPNGAEVGVNEIEQRLGQAFDPPVRVVCPECRGTIGAPGPPQRQTRWTAQREGYTETRVRGPTIRRMVARFDADETGIVWSEEEARARRRCLCCNDGTGTVLCPYCQAHCAEAGFHVIAPSEQEEEERGEEPSDEVAPMSESQVNQALRDIARRSREEPSAEREF